MSDDLNFNNTEDQLDIDEFSELFNNQEDTALKTTEDEADKTVEKNNEGENSQNLDLILDIPLEVSVNLGKTKLLIKELLKLGPGSIVELTKQVGEPMDILVNNKLIAHGEVVVIEDNFGIRITDIVNPSERVKNLA